MTSTAAASGPGDRPDDRVEPVPAPPPLSVTAPWLDNPSHWAIAEIAGAAARPGMFVYTRESRSFVRVAAVTKISGEAGRVTFVDLVDGRTLALDDTASVFTRTEI